MCATDFGATADNRIRDIGNKTMDTKGKGGIGSVRQGRHLRLKEGTR